MSYMIVGLFLFCFGVLIGMLVSIIVAVATMRAHQKDKKAK